MTYTITRGCCTDASCVSVCPVDCIHPRPGEPDFGKTEILYVDANVCIDCGACADACPVNAIKPADTLQGDELVFLDVNAEYYKNRSPAEANVEHTWDLMGPPRAGRPLRVAVVGTGPSASYATRALLLSTDTEVTILDRGVLPGGFVRAAVAPDHAGTKHFSSTFDWIHQHPRIRMYMNVSVGKDVTHEELLEYHDAVIYGVGADRDRPLGVLGEDLSNVYSAHQFVRWYNADDFVRPIDVVLSGGRAVIVGNGNVALDIARIVLSDPADLAKTEIAQAALDAIAAAKVQEVVILGRRGPEQAAFTRPELLMMPSGVELLIQSDPQTEADLASAEAGSKAALLARLKRTSTNLNEPPGPGRRAIFVFGAQVDSILGDRCVENVVVKTADDTIAIPASTVIRSIGHRGSPVAGLPFDDINGTIPHEDGRVIDRDTGRKVPGAYVVGWIKRGAQGGIGVNRSDAQETVLTLLADFAGQIDRPKVGTAWAFKRFVKRKAPFLVSRRSMRQLDQAERKAGELVGTPRQKWTSL